MHLHRTKKYKKLKLLAIINLFLLVANLFAFVFISMPRQAPVLAQKEELLCLRVCPSGEVTCDYGVCANTTAVSEEPVSEPAAETVSGGGQSAPPHLNEQQWRQYLVKDSPVVDRVDVAASFLIDTSGQKTLILEQPQTQQLTGLFNTLEGVTNLKEAIIVINFSGLPYQGITQADPAGRWFWQTPAVLPDGPQSLTVQAFSPFNAALNGKREYRFEINHPIDVAAPPVVPPEIGDLLPGKPSQPAQPLIERLGDLYLINASVEIPAGGLRPTNQLEVKTIIKSFDAVSAERFTLVFSLYDANGVRLYVEDKTITVAGELTDLSSLVTAFTLLPGEYLLAVELSSGNIRLAATQAFSIEAERPAFTAALVSDDSRLPGGLLISALFLYLLLILLIYLLYREYQRAKLALHQVSGEDLKRLVS